MPIVNLSAWIYFEVGILSFLKENDSGNDSDKRKTEMKLPMKGILP